MQTIMETLQARFGNKRRFSAQEFLRVADELAERAVSNGPVQIDPDDVVVTRQARGSGYPPLRSVQWR